MALRSTERGRLAIATLGVLGSLVPPILPGPPAQPQPPDQGGRGISAKIASTGNHSEIRRTVPVARHPGGGSRVAMSMTPAPGTWS